MNIYKKVVICLTISAALVALTGCISNNGTDPNANDDNSTILTDLDKDGTPDVLDNDLDNDGKVNTNDDDIDGDGKINTNDNDIDGDGIININDNDIDGDGIINAEDNDIDNDGESNGTDDDIDGDGVININDNDIDGDGITNTQDNDLDGDGITNNIDNDLDNDGVTNNNDVDIDGDGIPNSNDTDIDNDGTPNTSDTTPGGTEGTTTNGTQGQSNQGADVDSGTTNTGADQNSGSTNNDTYTSGIAISASDTLDYSVTIDATDFNGIITKNEKVNLQELRDVITEADVALPTFSITNMTISGSFSGAFLQQNSSKKVAVIVSFNDGGNTLTIVESAAKEGLAGPIVKLSDLTTGLELNKQIFASKPGFSKFISMIKDPAVKEMTVGISVQFLDQVSVSNTQIDFQCALKISGIKEL